MNNVVAILTAIWAFLNTPAGVALVAGAVIWALNAIYAKKPAWKAYEGSIITAIKLAEQNVPDNTDNKALHKLDTALKYVLQVYAATNNKPASPAVEASLAEGIQIKHDELEAKGTL